MSPLLSDERLREIAAYQPLDFEITHDELVGMAAELLSRRAADALTGHCAKCGLDWNAPADADRCDECPPRRAAEQQEPVAWPPAIGTRVSIEFEVVSHCSVGEPAWVGLRAPGILTDIDYAGRAALKPASPPPVPAGVSEELELRPLHYDLLRRGVTNKWIWLHDDAGMHTAEVVALGQLKRAGLVEDDPGPFPPGPPSMPPKRITDAGRALLHGGSNDR